MDDFGSFIDAPKKRKAKPEEGRGCECCSLNDLPGLHKIMGTVEGKDIAIMAQSPGPDENDEGRELVGRSGEYLWKELERVGIEREDCDIQNVGCRCMPCDVIESSYDTYLKMRAPTPQEIKCCSIYNEEMMPKLKAKQILIFGQIAAKAFLNTRSLPDTKIFYSDEHQAKIYLLDHPAFFIRGYGSEARLKAFREILDVVGKERGGRSRELADEYGYLRDMDYRLVCTRAEALEAEKLIRASKNRTSVDIEDAEIDGKRHVFAVGFCVKPGQAFVFDLRRSVCDVAKRILEDEKIKKAMQYGSSDCIKLEDLEGIWVRGFDHDTMLSEYLRDSNLKKYGLEAIVERRFPRFSNYKTIIVDDLTPEDLPERLKTSSRAIRLKYLSDKQMLDYGKLKPNTLRIYNGADCDVTKRIEVSNKKEVSQALMNLYIDLSFILYRMEPNGPLFDFEQNDAIAQIYPSRAEKLLVKLREVIKRPDFNPGSHPQVFDVVYNQLKLEYPLHKGKPNTGKKVLLLLSRQHPFPKMEVEWRAADKAASTYVIGYRKNAELNDGRLRTIWWAAGARTGRLRSGGRGKKDPSKINLQNIHNDPQIQNQCISDLRWRRVYRMIKQIISSGEEKSWAPRIEKWIRAKLPDLQVYLILDYGQVEVRVFAQMSGDKTLIKHCLESDIHTRVGVSMTGWKAEKIAHDKKTRTLTKNVHFGILFLISKVNLYDFVLAMSDPADQDNISREFVENAYDRYFETYPRVKKFQDKQVAFGEEHHYVETMFGMKQHLNVQDKFGGDDDDYEEGEEGAREGVSWKAQAVNGPVQGTAHQLLVCGLVNIRRQPEKYKILGTPVLDVHDNLTYSVPIVDLFEAAEKAKYLMEKESLATAKADFPGVKFDVPIVTEVEAGLSLGCKIEMDKHMSIGEFLLQWWHKRDRQLAALDKELLEIVKASAET